MRFGTKLKLRNCETDEIVEGVFDDAPGDNTVIYISALHVSGGQMIAGIEEAEYGDERGVHLEIGWHVTIDARRFEVVDVEA